MHEIIASALALVTTLAGLSAHAGGYVKDSAGEVVRNGYGECWRSGHWTPDDAVPGCDGAEVPAVAAVVEQTAVAVVPEVREVEPAVFESRVLFAFDSADLDAQATERLDELVAAIGASAGVASIRISGHTDRIGSEDYNLSLSERRAEAVRVYLTERLSRAIPVETQGRGEAATIAQCPDRRGAALIRCLQPDRRAEIEAPAVLPR